MIAATKMVRHFNQRLVNSLKSYSTDVLRLFDIHLFCHRHHFRSFMLFKDFGLGRLQSTPQFSLVIE